VPAELAQFVAMLPEDVAAGASDAGYWTHRDASGREFPVHVLSHRIDWEGCDADLVMIEEVATVS